MAGVRPVAERRRPLRTCKQWHRWDQDQTRPPSTIKWFVTAALVACLSACRQIHAAAAASTSSSARIVRSWVRILSRVPDRLWRFSPRVVAVAGAVDSAAPHACSTRQRTCKSRRNVRVGSPQLFCIESTILFRPRRVGLKSSRRSTRRLGGCEPPTLRPQH